jgi:putative flavoprotein involved in K+ transport
VAAKLSDQVRQLHSSAYRNADQLASGGVLVVGSQSSGCQIAEELTATRPVHLSTGRQALFALPQRILGKHPFWWLDKTGVIDITIGSRLGRWASTLPDPSIGVSARRLARRNGVDVLPRLSDVSDDEFAFADGRRLRVPNVVWATGYRHDFSWIDVPAFAADGRPRHHRGVTPTPGLYVLGLSWQHTRGSALIGWVGRDAEFLASYIVRRARALGQA